MKVSELETPALIIDLDIMERNLAKLADYTRAHSLRLRPHIKTHKIPALAKKQLDLGAVGITVAKVGEAEVMVDSGTPDILVMYPIIGQSKLDRLMKVAERAAVTVSVDSIEAATQLSGAAMRHGMNVGVMAEMDAGLGRIGVAPADLVSFVQQLRGLPGLQFQGVSFYPGHIKMMDSTGMAKLEALSKLLEGVRADLAAAGVEAPIVTGGSTPTLWHSHEVRGLSEIRPGTYIFNDRNTVLIGASAQEDCAASIMVTVVSTSVPNQYIVDGGSKTFSSDRNSNPDEKGFGYVVEEQRSLFARMNEEHGYVELPDAKSRFKVGDRVRIIPNHICVAMNLHERVYGIRGDEVEQAWNVAARGKLQ